METFEITVQELLSKKISVKAKNISDALNEVQKMYNDEKVVLDYTDLTMQEIIPTSQIDKKDKLINEVIE